MGDGLKMKTHRIGECDAPTYMGDKNSMAAILSMPTIALARVACLCEGDTALQDTYNLWNWASELESPAKSQESYTYLVRARGRHPRSVTPSGFFRCCREWRLLFELLGLPAHPTDYVMMNPRELYGFHQTSPQTKTTMKDMMLAQPQIATKGLTKWLINMDIDALTSLSNNWTRDYENEDKKAAVSLQRQDLIALFRLDCKYASTSAGMLFVQCLSA